MFSGSILIESFFAFLWALVVCSLAIPPIIYLSFRKRILDLPSDRRSHQDSTPRLGGLAIFAAITTSFAIFGDFSPKELAIQQVFAGILLLFFAGAKDDIVPITPFKKFFMQLLATGIVVFIGGLRITSLHGFFGIYELTNPGMSYALSFIIIVGIINAINLIDGINGLAGSLVFIMSLVFGLLFYQIDSPYAILAFATAGASIAFLKYNLIDGKIFMGDSGSLVLGFLMAIFSVAYTESNLLPDSKTPHFCIAILLVPIFDTLRVFITRILQGKSPFAPDKKHIHHILMGLGLSLPWTLISLLSLNILTISLVTFMPHVNINWFVGVLCVIAVGFSFVLKWMDFKTTKTLDVI